MKSFLSKYSRVFELDILNKIGEYSGSIAEDNMLFRKTTKLKFTIRKSGDLGKIYVVSTKQSKISKGCRKEKRLLRKQFWVAEKDAWAYFNVLLKLKTLESDSEETKNYYRMFRKIIEQEITTNYILSTDFLICPRLFG
jgi:hypothetical protein